jgi:hypothetical protein
MRIVLVVMLFAGSVQAGQIEDWERACDKGDVVSCGHAGSHLMDEYLKKKDQRVGERILKAFGRACEGRVWIACDRLVNGMQLDMKSAFAVKVYKRVCDAGAATGCMMASSTAKDPEKQRLEERGCALVGNSDSGTPANQWSTASSMCESLAMRFAFSDPVRAKQLQIVARMARLESNEARWLDDDLFQSKHEIQNDAWRVEFEERQRREQAILQAIGAGAQAFQQGALAIGAQLDANRAMKQAARAPSPPPRPPVSSFSAKTATPPPAAANEVKCDRPVHDHCVAKCQLKQMDCERLTCNQIPIRSAEDQSRHRRCADECAQEKWVCETKCPCFKPGGFQ